MPAPLDYEPPRDRATRSRENHELQPHGRLGVYAVWIPVIASIFIYVFNFIGPSLEVPGLMNFIVAAAYFTVAFVGMPLSIIGLWEKDCRITLAWTGLALNALWLFSCSSVIWFITHLAIGTGM